MILSPLESITPQLVEFALDGLSMRHQAIASNIANVNSAGYKPVTVSFESQINDLRKSSYSLSDVSENFQFKPIISYGKSQQQSNGAVGIDMNTVKLNQNVVQYHALIKGIDHYISTLSIAIKEGRG